jgi:pimeloyl-ACP methyl ester carboxylesterase
VRSSRYKVFASTRSLSRCPTRDISGLTLRKVVALPLPLRIYTKIFIVRPSYYALFCSYLCTLILRAYADFGPLPLDVLNYHGVDTFTIFSASGGGPFALAAAHYFPKARLKKTVILCGVTDPTYEQASINIRWKIQNFCAARLPALYRAWAVYTGRGRFYYDKTLTPEKNVENYKKHMEKYRQKYKGHVNDLRLHGRSWGFDWKEIQSNPIKWYHGGLDTNCSSSAAQQMGRAMKHAGVLKVTVFPTYDHYTIQDKEGTKLLKWLQD